MKKFAIVWMVIFLLATAFGTAQAAALPKRFAFIPVSAMEGRHKSDGSDSFIHISKHDLTLKKGNSETLKATLMPGGKSVSVKWTSSNPKIAKVTNAGKVTAVAPGTTVISIYSDKYYYSGDTTGLSGECYVTVQGGAKDAKPLGAGDRAFSYGEKKLTAPTTKYVEALTNIQKSIGGYAYSEDVVMVTYYGLIYGSKEKDKAHTDIYIYSYADEYLGFGFEAKGNSPIKMGRGIAIGSKKSAVQQQYGLPSSVYQYSEGGKTYEFLGYYSKEAGKNIYMIMTFHILKSKGTVSMMTFYSGK